jgi:hypothetical protein
VDVADHDHLANGPNATRYLVDHHVELPAEAPTEANLRDLQAIRDMVRALVESGTGWTPDARAVLARARFGLGLDGDITAEGSGWSGFIGDLMVPLLQVVELRDRLRLCGNPHCRLMFLDLSKNRARQWCDNGGCGNRDRVRRYRSRARVAANASVAST